MITNEEKNKYVRVGDFTVEEILAEYGRAFSESEQAKAEYEEENVSIFRDDPPEDEDIFSAEPVSRETEQDSYADADIDYAEAQADMESREGIRHESAGKPRPGFRDSVINPVIRLLALAVMKIKESRISLGAAPAEEAEDLGRELTPDRAVKFYENYLPSLSFRTKLSFLFTLILVYISYGLPMFSAMNEPKVSAAVCLVLLICVMLCGIDIITAGILSIARRRPNINSLVALSCLLSMADALLTAVVGGDTGLPFCGASALTLSFSLVGSVLNSRADRLVFKIAAGSHDPYILSADNPVRGSGITLLKSRRELKDFVRRTEEAGPDEYTYGAMALWLILASLILSLIAAAATKSFGSFLHIFSGVFTAAAPVTVLLAYPLPFFISTRLLLRERAAIAGWSGAYDIGKSRTLIITDRDLFPEGTVTIEKVRMLDGASAEKVISLVCSVMTASGCAMTDAFSELLVRGGGTMLPVTDFSCHEGGGFTAAVDGEQVICGSAGFMQLMGIRLPEGIAPRYSVFAAVSGVVSAIFEMGYTPTKPVRDSLISLLRSNRDPVFAVRDFNINPRMLSLKFDIPTDGFDFPSFADRFEISSAEPGDGSKPAAVMSRDGLDSLAATAELGRRLFTVVRLNVLLSVLSTVFGIAFMFLMFLRGNYLSASVSAVITYMFAWFLPQLALCFALKEKK